MKEKLTNNLAIKLIALFCAFFVWLAVVNVANPIKVSTREVPVTITNDQVLEQADLAYDVVGKKTATISFKIRTKDDYKVKASDFNAYADLSEMYDVTGAIPIRVEVVNNEELLESTPVVKSPEVIKITTEALQTKAFTLNAYPQSKAAEGYEAGEVTMVPSQVTVKGPTSLIGQISSVGIRFNIDGAAADVGGTATPEYFDANGNVLSDLGDSVKTVGGDVSYTMQILKVKEVPLDFDVSGEVADGYRYTGPKTDIKSVSVAGLKTDLASVSTLTIQGPSLNVQGATKNVECEIDLDDYLPSGLTIVGLDSTTINVTLQVEKLIEKTFTVKPEDVTLNGKNSSYSYTVEDTKMEVKVQGLEEDLSSLSAAKMNIRVDVSGMGLGEHTAAAQFQLGDAYKMLSAPAVTVRVSEHGSSSVQTTESTESDRGDMGSQSSSNRESGASSAKENVDAESGNAA